MELKEQILKSAGKLFFELGLKRVSIDDVCSDLRISKKTFYTVFKTKDELISDILKQIHCENNKKTEKVFDQNMNIIEFLMNKNTKFKQNFNEKHHQIFYDLKRYYPKIFEFHNKIARSHSIKTVEYLIKIGQRQGMFREDINMVLMPLMISDMFGKMFDYLEEKRGTWSYLMDFFVDSITRMLCNENGMEYYLKLKDKN